MKKKTVQDEATRLSDLIVEGLSEKKGKNIVRLDLRKVKGAVADYFVICTGTSDTHVQALSDSVYDFVKKKLLERPHGREGMQKGEWVLLDYVNVVAHIFLKDKRDFYNIEDLWGDAKFEKIES